MEHGTETIIGNISSEVTVTRIDRKIDFPIFDCGRRADSPLNKDPEEIRLKGGETSSEYPKEGTSWTGMQKDTSAPSSPASLEGKESEVESLVAYCASYSHRE